MCRSEMSCDRNYLTHTNQQPTSAPPSELTLPKGLQKLPITKEETVATALVRAFEVVFAETDGDGPFSPCIQWTKEARKAAQIN